MSVDEIASLLQHSRRIGDDRFVASCPAHEDSTPSLSLRQMGDRVLVFCHAGCSFQAIADAAGLDPRAWFNDEWVPASVRTAREVKQLEAQARQNMHRIEWQRVLGLGRELRRRDMERIAINNRVAIGDLSENAAMDLLEPIYRNYSEMEHEFTEGLRRL